MPSGFKPPKFETKVIVLPVQFDHSNAAELLSEITSKVLQQLESDKPGDATAINVSVGYRPYHVWQRKHDGTMDGRMGFGFVATATLTYEDPQNEENPFEDGSEVIQWG